MSSKERFWATMALITIIVLSGIDGHMAKKDEIDAAARLTVYCNTPGHWKEPLPGKKCPDGKTQSEKETANGNR